MITLRKTGSVLRFTVLGLLLACALSAAPARADVTVTVDPGAIVNGYMNVFELPSNGNAPVIILTAASGPDGVSPGRR